MFRLTRNFGIAFALTCAFMLVWTFSPLGEILQGLITRLSPQLAPFDWPICGLTFFWALRLILAIARPHNAKAPDGE